MDDPVIPELVGVSEAIEIVGGQRQTLSRLREAGGFPEPAQEFSRGPVWPKADVLRWKAGERDVPRTPVPPLMDANEIAALLKVDRTTVYRWVREGRLPRPVQPLRATMIWPRATIEALVAERRRLERERRKGAVRKTPVAG